MMRESQYLTSNERFHQNFTVLNKLNYNLFNGSSDRNIQIQRTINFASVTRLPNVIDFSSGKHNSNHQLRTVKIEDIFFDVPN